jgi:hypothetical protein
MNVNISASIVGGLLLIKCPYEGVQYAGQFCTYNGREDFFAGSGLHSGLIFVLAGSPNENRLVDHGES